jgi:hypothetical protein
MHLALAHFFSRVGRRDPEEVGLSHFLASVFPLSQEFSWFRACSRSEPEFILGGFSRGALSLRDNPCTQTLGVRFVSFPPKTLVPVHASFTA